LSSELAVFSGNPNTRAPTKGIRKGIKSKSGIADFAQKEPPKDSGEQDPISYLEMDLQTKDEVLADLMAKQVEHKGDGNSDWNANPALCEESLGDFVKAPPGDERD